MRHELVTPFAIIDLLFCCDIKLLVLALFIVTKIHSIGAILLLGVTALLFYVVSFQEILVVQLGGYKAPFGITFVIDRLSAIMLLITGIIGFCVSIYATHDIKTEYQKSGFYLAYWILLMGICGAFSTGDLFNLYVWFEVMLIASFVLLVLDNHRVQLDGALFTILLLKPIYF